jgi:hypothetical protein
MKFDSTSPEYASVESFAEFLMDEDRKSFLPGEAQAVSISVNRKLADVMAELKSYGFTVGNNALQKTGRGFTSNPNGTHPFQENPTFTTPGTSNILGFAGSEGY